MEGIHSRSRVKNEEERTEGKTGAETSPCQDALLLNCGRCVAVRLLPTGSPQRNEIERNGGVIREIQASFDNQQESSLHSIREIVYG